MDTVDECDRQTDGQTDGQTDRITITDTVQRIASHGKNLTNTYRAISLSAKLKNWTRKANDDEMFSRHVNICRLLQLFDFLKLFSFDVLNRLYVDRWPIQSRKRAEKPDCNFASRRAVRDARLISFPTILKRDLFNSAYNRPITKPCYGTQSTFTRHIPDTSVTVTGRWSSQLYKARQ